MSGLVHSSDTWSQNSGSSDYSELRCAGLSIVLEAVRWGDVIHVCSSIACWRWPVCPNTGVGRLCRSPHQESLLFVLHLQNSLVGRRAPREILSSDATYYKEYMGTMMVLTPITLSWRKFSFFCPFISGSYFCFSFPAFITFSETLVCLYHFLSFKPTCRCSLIVLHTKSTICGMRWNLVPITFSAIFWLT